MNFSDFLLQIKNFCKKNELFSAVVLICMSCGCFLIPNDISRISSFMPALIVGAFFSFSTVIASLSCSACLIFSICSPFATLCYFVYGIIFPLLVNFYLSFDQNKSKKEYSLVFSRVLLNFFSSSVVILCCALFYGVDFLVPLFSEYLKQLWLFPGILAFILGLISFFVLPTVQKLFSLKRFENPLVFSVTTFDYFWMAICIGGAFFFSGEESLFFINFLIMSFLPFFIEGTRIFLSFISSKNVLRFFILAGLYCILVIPIIIFAICSFFRPWLKCFQWLNQEKGDFYGNR